MFRILRNVGGLCYWPRPAAAGYQLSSRTSIPDPFSAAWNSSGFCPMGMAYVFVLGVEAIAAVLLSALVLHESYTASHVAAIALIVIGIAWLRV